MKKLLITMVILGYPIYSIASTPCDYDYKINSEYTKTIQSTKNFKRKVFPYIEDARKCVVSMEIKMDNKWYDTNGMFTFGPDMSENEACKNAEKRAKEKIIRKVSPEKLTAQTDMVCKQEKTEVVTNQTEINKNNIPKIGTVMSEKIIYEQQVVVKQPKVIYVDNPTTKWVPDNNFINQPFEGIQHNNDLKISISGLDILGLLFK